MIILRGLPIVFVMHIIPARRVWVLWGLGFCSLLSAQRYHTRTYDYASGLPSVDTAGVAQDARGNIWIASRAGPIEYDGLNWKLHRQTARSTGDAAEGCSSDSSGRIWIVSGNEAAYFENDKWHDLPTPFRPARPALLALTSLHLQGKGYALWAAEDLPVTFWNGQRWTDLVLELRDGQQATVSALAASRRFFWIATNQALFRLDPLTGLTTLHVDFDRNRHVQGIGFDPARNALWLIGRSWIGRLHLGEGAGNPRTIEVLLDDLELGVLPRRLPIFRVQDDGRGGVWFGNGFIVCHLENGRDLKLLYRRHGLVAEGLTSLFKDREQNIWITSKRGITKIICQRFVNYDSEDGLLDDEVSALCQMDDGTMVLGHPGGLTFLDPGGPTLVRILGDSPKNRVMDLSVDREGRLWVACDGVGLGIMNKDARSGNVTRRIDWLPDPPTLDVYSICHDEQGTPWIGTARGVYKIEDRAFVFVPFESTGPLPNSPVRRVVTASGGVILAASFAAGILEIRNGLIVQRPTNPAYRSTFTALEFSDGNIWGGSKKGLLRLHDGRYLRSNTPSIHRPVYGLLEDAQRRLWIGTDNGIYRWDGVKLEHFTTARGLAGAEINRAALIEDNRKRIWIGTDRGVSIYDPDLDTRILRKPLVRLTALEVSGKLYSMTSPLSLPADSRDLSFRFSASSFVDEDGVLFRTRLEGFDREWSAPRKSPLREIRYTNLPAGDYRFGIQAIDVEGNQSQEVISPVLTIERAFYTRTWFLALSVLAALGLVWSGFAFLNQRRYARNLEAQVRLRTDELREAERTQARSARLESLGALAGGIAHDFNNLLTAITGYSSLIGETAHLDDRSRGFVKEVEKACERAQALTRQLLTFSCGGTPVRSLTSINGIIRDAVKMALMGSSIEHELDLAEDLPAAHVDAGQFHQVFNNLIINARQAMSKGGVVRISTRVETDTTTLKKQIVIEISDEGHGIPEDLIAQVFDPYFTTKSEGSGLGLAIVHSIITRHGGTVTAKSVPTGGATFRIAIPAATGLPPPRPLVPRRPALEPGRILVMDDESTIRSFVRIALESRDCEVIETSDGAAAVQAYEAAFRDKNPFSAVITDLTIPGGMGGQEAARAILDIDPDAQLIVTSGYANEPILADYESFGFSGRLTKPFSVTDLIRVLGSIQGADAREQQA